VDEHHVGLLFDGEETSSSKSKHSSKLSSKQSYKSGEEGAIGLEQFEICSSNVEFADYYVGQGSQGKVRGGTYNKCRVAIKFFQAGPRKTKCFRREAATLLRLRHPHILLVMGIISMPPTGFAIVSELCMGASLFYRLFKKKDINLRCGLVVGTQVGSALAYLHGRRYHHRDVKASNVFLLNRSRDEPIAKLGDFASCRAFDSGGLTPGHTVGTPGYMAPEMARDEPYDQSADIFSLGLLLYELIAQQRAWSGDDLQQHGSTAMRVDEDNPKSMADLVPDLLEVSKLHVIPNLVRLDDVLKGSSSLVGKCLSHDSADRPTAAETVAGLIVLEQNFHQL
jgi:serine/threonine protein kinase